MASKGRNKERPSKGSSGTPDIHVETVVVEKDIVPGKITEKEWNELISVDDGVEMVCEMVEEITENAYKIVYDHYLTEHAFPYAINDAKETILRIITLQFVARDEGEGDTSTDPSWLPAEEPVPAPIDSWACGSVPLASSKSLHSFMDSIEPVQIQKTDHQTEPEADEILKSPNNFASPKTSASRSSRSSQLPLPRKKSKHGKLDVVVRQDQGKMVALEEPPPGIIEIEQAERQLQTPSSTLHIPSSLTSDATPSPRGQGKPTPFGLNPIQLSWMKEVKYDKRGNIVDMIKLDPTKFPSYSRKPIVSVSRPPKDYLQLGFKKRKSKKHLRPLQNYSPTHSKTKQSISFTNTLKSQDLDLSTEEHEEDNISRATSYMESRAYQERSLTVLPSASGLSEKRIYQRFPSTPTLPSLVDTIDPLPGVTVTERGRSVQGPTPHFRPPSSPRAYLRPVKPLMEGKRSVPGERDDRMESKKQFNSSIVCAKVAS